MGGAHPLDEVSLAWQAKCFGWIVVDTEFANVSPHVKKQKAGGLREEARRLCRLRFARRV
jgi:hypothetical protein